MKAARVIVVAIYSLIAVLFLLAWYISRYQSSKFIGFRGAHALDTQIILTFMLAIGGVTWIIIDRKRWRMLALFVCCTAIAYFLISQIFELLTPW